MACTCADEIDTKLAERNTALTRAWLLKGASGPDNPNLMLQTHQVQTGRGKPKAVSVFIAYCPFCGTKYNEAG